MSANPSNISFQTSHMHTPLLKIMLHEKIYLIKMIKDFVKKAFVKKAMGRTSYAPHHKYSLENKSNESQINTDGKKLP
jgi:hypothetical protein